MIFGNPTMWQAAYANMSSQKNGVQLNDKQPWFDMECLIFFV